MGQNDGVAQLVAHQQFCLVHLLFRNSQCRQAYLVELQLILTHGFVTTLANVGQHRAHRLVQLGQVQSRALNYLGPLFLLGILVYLHLSYLLLLTSYF